MSQTRPNLKMSTQLGKFKPTLSRFGVSSEDEKAKILTERNAKNTNKSTTGAVRCLEEYLQEKGLHNIANTSDADLPSVLEDFYVNARTKKTHERYHTQSLKCLRAGLNRFFQETRNINIINDPPYMKCNMMFRGIQVQAKKEGKGACRSTPVIKDEDMTTLAKFFNHDQVTNPSPRLLQRNVIFNIIYYFCRRGQENLHDMTVNWFEVVTQPNGEKFVIQVKDELDKNHRENSHQQTNQGKMYQVNGK